MTDRLPMHSIYWLEKIALLLILVLISAGCVIPESSESTKVVVNDTTITPGKQATIQDSQAAYNTLSPTLPEPSNTPGPTFPEPTNTPPLPSPTQALPMVYGSLNDLLTWLEGNAPRQGSQGFVEVSHEAMSDFNQLMVELLARRFKNASELATKYDYELALYQDGDIADTEYLVLRELDPIRRGWGLYVFRLEACQSTSKVLVIEAPHILADEGTPLIALDAFRALQGCALMIAGAHRSANQDGIADVAHNPQSVFQAIHSFLANIAGPNALVLQFHGFAMNKHQGYPPLVLGGSSPDLTSWTILLASLTQGLAERGISTGVCDGIQWTDLCGETNAQASNLTAGIFVHLELDDSIRSAPGELINALVTVFSQEP